MTSTAAQTAAAFTVLSRVVSPSRPTPAARLATGVTTVTTGKVIMGRPAWYAVWVSRTEQGPTSTSAYVGQAVTIPLSPCPSEWVKAMVTTAMPVSARPAARASRMARRRPAAASPAAANGAALAPRQRAASPVWRGRAWPTDRPGDVRATKAPIPATTARQAAQVTQPSRRPDHTRTVATLKMSEDAVSIWTTVSGPACSATAWMTNPPNSPTKPSSHHGRRRSRRSRDGRPADVSGAAAA